MKQNEDDFTLCSRTDGFVASYGRRYLISSYETVRYVKETPVATNVAGGVHCTVGLYPYTPEVDKRGWEKWSRGHGFGDENVIVWHVCASEYLLDIQDTRNLVKSPTLAAVK